MAFNINDIYTSSGSAKLYNSWTPTVAKFDTSSFYNWEQDNLPVYDLEERTYELWEYNGFTTSSVPGIALTVSADAPAASLLANRNIFTTVSAAIAALPRVIRCPILIEVCNYGDMGKLELHDFQIMERGSLEIINRTYSTVYDDNISTSVSATAQLVTTSPVAGHTLIRRITSSDLSSTLTSTSAVNLGVPVFSSTAGTRFSSVNSFLYQSVPLKKGCLSVGIKNSSTLTTTANTFIFIPYETAYAAVDSVTTLDFTSINEFDGASMTRDAAVTGSPVLGAVYGNNFKQISVKNCSGKIYIRNFCVIGDTRSYAGLDNGIEVVNADVVLENCAAVNALVNGFYFSNSKVILSRMAFAYRNYYLTAAATRSSNQSCGFRAVNSEVTLSSLPGGSSTTARDYQTSGSNAFFCASRNKIGFLLENSVLNGGLSRVVAAEKNKSSLALEINEEYGLRAINSQINIRGLLDVYENKVGIDLLNSVLLAEELTCEFNQKEGLRAKNSTIISNEYLKTLVATIDNDSRAQVQFYFNGQHLNLDNSTFNFKKTTNNPTVHGGMTFKYNVGLSYTGDSGNKFPVPGIRLVNNSKAELIHSQHLAPQAYCGTNVYSYGRLISADSNSTVSLYGTGAHCTVVRGPEDFLRQKYMAAISGKNGSVVNLFGPTVISQAGVDVLVEDNSTLNISPPVDSNTGLYDVSGFNLSTQGNQTAVELHSTRACLVANNNSVINMENIGANNVNWSRGPLGQIANNNAQTDLSDLTGELSNYIVYGKVHFYPNPYDAGAVATGGFDGMADPGTSPQFALDSGTQTLSYISTSPTRGGVCVRALGNSTVNAHNVNFGPGPNTGPLDGLYYDASGSTCNQLMIWNIADDSKLRASLLSVSSVYGADSPYYGPPSVYVSSNTYGQNATGTNVTYGAPIGTPDTGSLSVLDSFGAGGSSVATAWKPLSGTTINSPFDYFFPIKLLQASSLSALDSTLNKSVLASSLTNNAGIAISGITVTGIQYGTSSTTHYKNNGMFRIYFSPNPACKYLQHDISGYAYGPKYWNLSGSPTNSFSGTGIIYQIFAQGYNLSAPVSAINTYGDVSAYYPQLLKLSRDADGDGIPDTMHPSGFYYCTEFLPDNPTQVILDESAAYVFANARNASLGSSGRPRRVSIYTAGFTPATGESNDGDVVGFISTNVFDLKRNN